MGPVQLQVAAGERGMDHTVTCGPTAQSIEGGKQANCCRSHLATIHSPCCAAAGSQKLTETAKQQPTWGGALGFEDCPEGLLLVHQQAPVGDVLVAAGAALGQVARAGPHAAGLDQLALHMGM